MYVFNYSYCIGYLKLINIFLDTCFAPNTVYQGYPTCVTTCEPTCENPNPTCTNVYCDTNTACKCANGFIRKSETDHTCIPEQECPSQYDDRTLGPTCEGNKEPLQRYFFFGTCQNPISTLKYIENEIPSCQCELPLFLDEDDGICKEYNDCPPFDMFYK